MSRLSLGGGEDDDEDDLDDMWAELDDDNFTANVSENLLQAAEKTEQAPVHVGEADEGQLTWEPPKTFGLSNSDKVTVQGHHWDREDRDRRQSSAQQIGLLQQPGLYASSPEQASGALQSAGLPAAASAAAVSPTPAFASMFKLSDDGRIQW